MSAGPMPMFRYTQVAQDTEKYAGALSETKVEYFTLKKEKTIIVVQNCEKGCGRSDYTAYYSIIPFFLLFLFPFRIYEFTFF